MNKFGFLLTKNRIGAFLLLAFCVAYAFLSRKIRLLPFQEESAFHARTMPEVLSVLGIGLSLTILTFAGGGEKPGLAGYDWKKGILFLALMSVYGFTIRPFGFLPTTVLFLAGGFALLGERSVLKMLLVSVPLAAGFWLLMTQVLGVYISPLPYFLKLNP